MSHSRLWYVLGVGTSTSSSAIEGGGSLGGGVQRVGASL
uniref:Uncharacterized protein n=1 Tax=Glycine max TaxID=3847 RepID=C6T144_SOYBN|nr:unknown [Glycine max]